MSSFLSITLQNKLLLKIPKKLLWGTERSTTWFLSFVLFGGGGLNSYLIIMQPQQGSCSWKVATIYPGYIRVCYGMKIIVKCTFQHRFFSEKVRIYNGFKLHKFASEVLWGLRRPPGPPAWGYGLEYFCHYIPEYKNILSKRITSFYCYLFLVIKTSYCIW